jgi:hypothetical protein
MPQFTRLFLTLGLVGLLSGCQLGNAPAADPDGVTPNAVAGDAIEVTALDQPGATVDAAAQPGGGTTATAQTGSPEPQDDPAPEAVPEPAPQPDLAVEVPATPKSEQQLACEKKKGRWTRTGKSDLHTCVYTTRDGGKQCTRESQCEGLCLARSGTCSPIKPLLGCNEILQDNGARVTLCID